MAKPKATRKVRKASNAAKRPSRRDQDERLHLDLSGAHAAAMTCVSAIGFEGPTRHIAFNLRRAVVNPLEQAIAILDARQVRS